MKRKTLTIGVGGVLLAATIGALVWQVRLHMQPTPPARSAVVERGSIRVVVSASGSIAPLTRAALSFESSGQVAEVAVAVGDRVEAGQVLARLDPSQLELQVAQAQASLRLAEAQLAQLQAGPRPEEIAASQANLRAAEARVAAAAASLEQATATASRSQVAAAETQLASAQLQERLAQQEYDRVVESTGRDTREEAIRQREQAGERLVAARKQVEAAQAQLERLLAGADRETVRAARANLAGAQAQRDAAQAQLDQLLAGATPEQVAEAQAQVTQARVALELAELALERATLRAPFAGEVAAVNIRAGEMASPGLPAFVLLDTSRLRLTVGVDEMDVGRLTVGQTADVSVDAFPGRTIPGTIESIAPTARLEGGVVTYDVVIGLQPGDVPLRADMTATAAVLVEELNDVLILPASIVRVDRLTGQRPGVGRLGPG
jgi:HlyD family secretion protein